MILIFALFTLITSQKDRLEISSLAFGNKGVIPMRYTCEGENINPALIIHNIPAGTSSLALVVEDPDAPGTTFDHWVLWNIKPTDVINENFRDGMKGVNGVGKKGYTGPCPPDGHHRYLFKVYALDRMLELKEGSDKKALEHAIKGHVLASGELIGSYKKNTHEEQ